MCSEIVIVIQNWLPKPAETMHNHFEWGKPSRYLLRPHKNRWTSCLHFDLDHHFPSLFYWPKQVKQWKPLTFSLHFLFHCLSQAVQLRVNKQKTWRWSKHRTVKAKLNTASVSAGRNILRTLQAGMGSSKTKAHGSEEACPQEGTAQL